MYRRRATRYSIFHTAGWLFADLLLALTVIFMAASTNSQPAATINPASITPTPTPVPTLAPTTVPQGLDSHSFTFSITIDPLRLGQPDATTIAQVQGQVSQALAQSQNSNRHVGFVLDFAGGSDGVNNATNFNAILQSMPAFNNAVLRPYHDLSNQPNEFDLEIYFLIG